MKRLLIAAALIVFSARGLAAEDPLNLPCTALPSTAVKFVPGPFDAYMQLACTHSGQVLMPKPGTRFVFREGPMALSALNADKPKEINEAVHFTVLTVAPLDVSELASLRADLHKIATSPIIDQSTIIRMREETSTGAHKQIYLLIPLAGVKGHILGMECNHDCRPVESDPWFFSVVPDSEMLGQ